MSNLKQEEIFFDIIIKDELDSGSELDETSYQEDKPAVTTIPNEAGHCYILEAKDVDVSTITHEDDGSSQSSRPQVKDEMHVIDVDEDPFGVVLEPTLQLKRKRAWSPFEDLQMSSPAGAPAQRPPLPSSPQNNDDIPINLQSGSEEEPDTDEDDVVMVLPAASRPARLDLALALGIDSDSDSEAPPPLAHRTAPSADTEAHLDLFEPNDFFHFVWGPFPDLPIPPESRRETFNENNVGPTAPCVDPYQIFVSIWDRHIMEHIVSETNQHALEVMRQFLANKKLGPHSRIAHWRDTTVDELYLYLAVVLAMGLLIKSRVEDYWSHKPDFLVTPGFGAVMSADRFVLLGECLHFNNNRDMCGQGLNSSEAKLFKIAPVLSHLNDKFQIMYNLGQNIAVDESLLQWNGWLNMNRYVPDNASKIGIKSYEVCESQTGYLWRFEVCAHRSDSAQAIVLRLIRGLENKGHTLWMDNYYNSPSLARTLKSIGFDCVGTLRTNREFVPEELASFTKENMLVGQVAGCTSGDVDLMVWRDSNRVGMISTYHGNAAASVDGVRKPILILDYNFTMGGVDKKDQRLAAYPIERKRTKVWYKKLFLRLLNVSVLNAFIIHKASATHSALLTHRLFRENLVDSIIQKHNSSPRIVSTPIKSYALAMDHYLTENPMLPGRSGRQRRQCSLCKKRTSFTCVGCNKPCCLKCIPFVHPP